jgi:hypothetical protein
MCCDATDLLCKVASAVGGVKDFVEEHAGEEERSGG